MIAQNVGTPTGGTTMAKAKAKALIEKLKGEEASEESKEDEEA